jgi:hypothetical protein
MAGAIGVLGLLIGAILFRTARKRMSVHWLIAIVVVGALSGLLLGRAATLPPGGHTELYQRGSIALVLVAWWYLVRGILAERARSDD